MASNDMSLLHTRIVDQLVDRIRTDESVIAITLFGSWAKGTGTPNSDIDVEIISDSAGEWCMSHERIQGVRIDIVVVPHCHLRRQVEDYPFLCYDYLTERILYDPKGVMAKAKAELEAYFANHPEIVEYWEADLAAMQRRKANGVHRKNDIITAYDRAELLFSKDHKISRDFLRE